MAAPNQKLAASLAALRTLQKNGNRVFQSRDLSRPNRERLLRNGFVQEVMKGWLISASPAASEGDSTPWYASFWEFCARYCGVRFGRNWHLSPEQSMLLHAEKTVIPAQVVIHATRGTNNKMTLLYGTSLYDLKQSRMPARADLMMQNGLRLFTPAASLVGVSEAFFSRNPVETQVVLASLADETELLRRLLDGGHSIVAGRLAGGFRRIGRASAADEILRTMKSAGYDARELDPFAGRTLTPSPAAVAPIVGRMRLIWQTMRSQVLDVFPAPPGLPADSSAYLKRVDESYQNDAWHSLSIEGYTVSPALIDRVRAGAWDPDTHDAGRQSRDALAARGYWQAFQAMKANVGEIITGANPGGLVRNAHRNWYRELFQPCVGAGLIPATALAGYRNDAVYLRQSRYVPPRWETVREAMPALFDLLEAETEPAVRAVLGHWLFGFIHPYPDGNGRVARFLMNAMLASGGYPWTVIRVEERASYLKALDSASVDEDIRPFAKFIGKSVRRSSSSLYSRVPVKRAL